MTKQLSTHFIPCALATFLFPFSSALAQDDPSADGDRAPLEETVVEGAETQPATSPEPEPEPAIVEETPAPELEEEPLIIDDDGFFVEEASSAMKMEVPILETPQSIEVVTDSEMEAQGVDTLAEAFRYTPGVQSEFFGFETRFTWIRIRGIDATQTGLYRDGLQLRNPGFLVSYDLIPYAAERIEIPKGPASVLYGASSAGGLVNFVTKRPKQETFYELGGFVGNDDHYETRFDVNTPLNEGGELTGRLTGVLRDSGTQQDFVQDDGVYVAPSFTWRPREGTSVTLLTHFQQDETKASSALPLAGTMTANPNGTIPVNRFTGEPELDRYERDEASFGLFTDHEVNDWLTLSQSSRFYRTELDTFLVFPQSLAADQRTLNRSVFTTDSRIDAWQFDNRAQFDFSTGGVDHKVLAGVDHLHLDVEAVQRFGFNAATPLDLFDPVYGGPVGPAPVFNDTRTIQEQTGLYLQDHLDWNDRLFLTLSGRYDMAESEAINRAAGTVSEQEDEEFTGRAGVLYKTGVGLNPYFSYSESFFPTAGTDPVGRPFDPELGSQWEFGAKFQPTGSDGHVTVSYFDLTRENFTETDPATFLPVQTGEITSRGLEVDGRLPLGRRLDFQGNFTYLDAEITESVDPASVGERPRLTPEYIASAWFNYSFGGRPFPTNSKNPKTPGISRGLLDGLHLRAGARYIDSTFGDVPNTLESQDAVVADFGFAYEMTQSLTLNLTIQNAFDEEYVASTFDRSGTGFGTFGQTRDIVFSVTGTW